MDQNNEIKSPRVSVVIPVYNTEAYVEEAVRSIMNQTLKDIEIIIIDDGSTDNSSSIIAEISKEDSRINIYSQNNCGLSLTRNRGIEYALGEYIYFMDSDDLLDPNALKTCYMLATERNLDFVFFDSVSFSDEGIASSDSTYFRSFLFDEDKVYTGLDMLNRMLDSNIYRASACLNFINHKFLNKYELRFFPGIIHEDELFTSQLYLFAKRVSCIKETFYKRRLRSESIMTKKFSTPNIEGYLTVVGKLKLLSKKEVTFRATVDRLISYILNPAIYNSKELSLIHRLKVFIFCIEHQLVQYLEIKNIFVLLFPFLVTLKGILKRKG